LLAPLRHRKKRVRLISDSKGFSSIVGAVFAVLVMMSLVSTVFVWSLSQNTLYNNAVTQTRQADLDRSNENIVANVTCLPVDSNNVEVNGTLENDGPLSTQIVTLWVIDTNPTTSQTTYFHKPLSITLKSGNVTTLPYGSTATTVPLANSQKDSLSCWFISGRGNTIYQNPMFNAGNTTNNYSSMYANVSSGIGLIGFDFKEFSHYDTSSSNTPGTLNLGLLAGFSKTYAIDATKYIIFHVVLTNYDPYGQTMYLNSSSAIYVVGSHSQTLKYDTWGLVNVTGDSKNGYVLNPAWVANYTLPLYTPVDIFFAGAQTGSNKLDTPFVYPLNILVFGKLGTGDYGQNVPFVALNFL
jgi:hypothetical protein